jgi:hypothetical protein
MQELALQISFYHSAQEMTIQIAAVFVDERRLAAILPAYYYTDSGGREIPNNTRQCLCGRKEDYMEANLMEYIIQEAYILVPVLYVIGVFLKRTPKVPDWLIPWILTALGMIGAFFLSGMKLSGILQGVLVAGVTVFANQLYKQTTNRQ